MCPFLALGIYFLSYPAVIAPGADTGAVNVGTGVNVSSLLFPGKKQDDRYGKILNRIMEENRREFETLGLTAKDIGTHSVRKGAATFSSSGVVQGPSVTSICRRAGWTLPGVLDTYLRYEAAGDQFVGRTVTGLPCDRAEFALLPPFFDIFESPADHAAVDEAIHACFPIISVSMQRVIRLVMASVVYHREFLRSVLPPSHPLLRTAIFRNPDMMSRLARLVVCRLPKPDDFMKVTGIPAHVSILRDMRQLGSAVESIVPAVRTAVPEIVQGVTQNVCIHVYDTSEGCGD